MDNSIERIGWIGLGNMGHPMAKNLEKAGFTLTVYNRTPEKAADFTALSQVSDSVEALVDGCDIIFTMLTNDEAVKAVYEMAGKRAVAGKLFIDMSTISQQLTVDIAGQLQAKQALFIDAPVAGSTQPAREGTLIIMAGGEKTALERAMPYLEKLGKQVKHLGGNGKGIAAKLSINYFLSVLYQGLAETVLFAEKLGIARQDMLDIINESASGSGATRIKTPLLVQEHYAPAFALELMLKDVLLAEKAGAVYPLSKAVVPAYRQAAEAGLGKEDVIGIINYLRGINS